ncbi:hypothetical protein PGT21_029289 [Puccinia graminis f. sp. tritici]|uniref:Uncharacterized protein n=1 Tax=Puccinia graminis f. sp. tritici TaxID=56615 RepID=A0A5B0S4D6_PUCGR|nr:hypothetical protein PGT21_029289 [Puccinia graminis f. sp. tritici]KAA1133036.1 hypothetical protein PGTUg99_025026 [Puccinia graminis f. sp. tritici]
MMYIRHHTAGRGTADSSAEQNKKHNQTTHRAKRHPWPISNRQDSKRWSRRAHRVLHLQLAKLGFLILPVVSLAKVPQLSSVGDGFDDTYSTQLRPIQKSPDKLYTFVRQRSPVIKFDRRLIGDRFLFL